MNSHGKVSSLVGRKRRVSNGTQVLAHAVASPWQLTLSLTDQEINSPIAIFVGASRQVRTNYSGLCDERVNTSQYQNC